MKRSAKHWIDPGLRAANVREVDIGGQVLARLDPLVPALQAMTPETKALEAGGIALSVSRPKGWGSDVAWISQADVAAFAFFDALFAELDLARQFAPHIACDRAPVLYSGFFVTRSRSTGGGWHYDWIDGNNDGFTLIAPISANCAELGLVYHDLRGEERRLDYRRGKGVVFGDHFHHATAPGETAQPTVLLSLSFGTDRMERWHRLSATAAHQGLMHRRPDGVFVRNGKPVSPP
jgi:hypothetical protein